MSFIKRNATVGKVYAPGYFLANNEDVTLKTFEASQSNTAVVTVGTAKYLPMGTPYPSNDANAIGIVYEDVDVSEGNAPGSLVRSGVVYESRLPVTLNSSAKNALKALGFVFLTEGSVTRPEFPAGELDEITVESAAGTAVGDTALTLSDYTPGTGESYVYKVGTTAPQIAYAEVPDYTWTPWDGTSDITAATDTKITVVSINAAGQAIAAGSATVTAKSA